MDNKDSLFNMRESILQRMLIPRSFARITMVAVCLASETSHGPR